jgi:hypothetical protein
MNINKNPKEGDLMYSKKSEEWINNKINNLSHKVKILEQKVKILEQKAGKRKSFFNW